MNHFPPMEHSKRSQEKENIYLSLVDMFVDVVEPDIVMMVLQNRNWDLDSALEDIMILSNTLPSEKSKISKKSNKIIESVKKCHGTKLDSQTKKRTMKNENSLIHMAGTATEITSSKNSNPEIKNGSSNQTWVPSDNKPLCYNTFNKENKTSCSSLSPFIDNFNTLKTILDPYSRTVMLIKSGVRLMVILRGPPGSGKSHLATKLLNDADIDHLKHTKHTFSSDNFFIQNNQYTFVPELLSEAHAWNQQNVSNAVKELLSPIIVDNTNTQSWEMQVYAKLAVSAGYDIEILEPATSWIFKESELAKKNVHGVPKQKIRVMIERYEKHITPNKLLQQFDLRYSLSNAPPQQVRSSGQKNKLSSYRNNKPKKKNNASSKNSNFYKESNCLNMPNKLQTLPFHTSSFQFSSPRFGEFNLQPSSRNTNVEHDEVPYQRTQQSSSCLSDQIKESSDFPSKEMKHPLVSLPSSSSKSFAINSVPNLSCLSPDREHKNGESFNESSLSFDFMAESNRLLAALGRTPLKSKQDIASNSAHKINKLKSLEILFKSNNIQNPQNQDLKFETEENHHSNEQPEIETKDSQSNSECVKEKAITGEDQNYTIVEVMENPKSVKNEESTGTSKYHKKYDGVSLMTNKRDYSWDYVLVKDDNSFVYKSSNVKPLPFLKTVCTTKLGLQVDQITNAGQPESEKSLVVERERNDDSNDQQNKSNAPLQFDIDSNQSEFVETCQSEKIEMISPVEHVETPENYKEIINQYELKDIEYVCENRAIHDSPSLDNSGDVLTVQLENSQYTDVNNHNKMNVMGMMENILSSMTHLQSSETTSVENQLKNNSNQKSDVNNCSSTVLSEEDGLKNNDNEFKNSFKPPRNLTRARMSVNSQIYLQEETSPLNLESWDTVSNPCDHWSAEEVQNTCKKTILKEEEVSLPQRAKTSKRLVDSSTNTNYYDFSRIKENNLTDVKLLTGNCKAISDICQNTEQVITESLLLNKSTMTSESLDKSEQLIDLNEISNLLPEIPKQYVLDMVEKCQGDIDWAVDLLLDSEHSFYPESDDNSISEGDQFEEPKSKVVEISEPYFQNDVGQIPEIAKPDTSEHLQLKKLLESSVVLNKSHYSKNILKVIKHNNPNYLSLIENKGFFNNDTVSQDSESSEPLLLENLTLPEDESSGCCSSEDQCADNQRMFNEKNEVDDIVELVVNSDIILQLQQKFGNASTPSVMDMTPVVKLPVSLARQIYGYIMDAVQSEIDEQQENIENMIAKDEEIAKLLQYQDQNEKPELQEIMDMEVALAVHRADQDQWKEQTNNTVAAKLSKNILLEKFPHADPKVLMEMLHAHNYSLHDTIASLTLALEESNPHDSTELGNECSGNHERLVAEPLDECVDPLTEAQSHRQEAATYYSLRMECLNKAHQAFRSGNKQVASYYSQLAQTHKGKIEHCNSQAAACLLSTHKSGNTLDLHFLHVTEAEVVLDMFLDEIVAFLNDRNKRYQTVFLITGRGLRSVGGVSRIKPMVVRKLQARKVLYNEVNPGMLSALIKADTLLSCIYKR